MPKVEPKRPRRVRAREAFVTTIGARPVEYHKRIVRGRRTGKLAEIDVHELGYKDEGDLGISYAFARGEEVEADHPAVLHKAGYFVPIEDD